MNIYRLMAEEYKKVDRNLEHATSLLHLAQTAKIEDDSDHEANHVQSLLQLKKDDNEDVKSKTLN